MKKAQLTIEYITVLVIMLLIFNSVTLDLVNISVNDANTIQTAEIANSSKIIIEDAVKTIIYQGVGARKTVYIRAPPDCGYTLASNVITLDCAPQTPSFANFDGLVLSPTMPPGTSLLINGQSSGTIKSGELGSVTVRRTA